MATRLPTTVHAKTPKNAQDATLRNVRAAHTRDANLRKALARVRADASQWEIQLGEHEARLRKLESVLFFGGGQLKATSTKSAKRTPRTPRARKAT